MSSISCTRTSYVDFKAKHIHLGAPSVSAAGVRNIVRLFAVALGAASLAACAQSSVVTKQSESLAPSRQASLEHKRKTALLSTLPGNGVTFDCSERSDLNRLAEGAYSENGDNRPMRLRC